MRLSGIRLTNFMPFGEDITLDLPKTDDYMVLVRGKNGQGKSGLFEAVYWCLTGTTVRGVKAEEVLRHGTKECVVETTWELTPTVKDIGPAGTYTIRRLWSKANKQITVERPGKRKQKVFHNTNDGTKYIREMIGIDPEVLGLVAFFGRKFQTFSRMKPTERAHIIDLLARAATWEAARKHAGSEARDRKARESEIRRARDRSKEDLEERLAEVEPLRERIQEMEASQKANVGQLKKRIGEITKQIKKEKETIETDIKRLDKLEDEREKRSTAAAELRTKISTLKERARSAKDQLKRQEELLDNDECPMCGQSMEDEVEHLNKHAEELRAAVNKADREAAKQKEKLDALNAQMDTTFDEEISPLDDGITNLESSVRILETEKKKHELAMTQASNDTELARLTEKLRSLEEDIIPPLQTGIEEHQERLEEATDYREAFEFWQEGFKYIRFMVMEQTVKGLSALVSATVLKLGLEADGAEVTLWNPDSKGSKKAEIGLYIKRGEYRDSVEALSEGETQRIDLACYVALGEYVRRILGVDPGFRVLDEPLNHLDEDGKFEAFQLIAQHIPGQRFVMDHDANFADLFTEQIMVAKTDGVSAIQQI